MILKIRIFFQAIKNFFIYTFAYWDDVETVNDFLSDVLEAFVDAVCFYKLNTDPEFIAIEKELAELDSQIESIEKKLEEMD